MKKTAALLIAMISLAGCGADQELIQKSMNNIKDEMLGIQSTMGDMQVKMQDMDKSIRLNSDNINKNSDALAQLREEMTVMNTDIIDLKDRVSTLEKGKSGAKAIAPAPIVLPSAMAEDKTIAQPAQPKAPETMKAQSTDDVIIIEDNAQDRLSLYTYAYELYRNGKYAESEAKFNEFLKKYPNAERSDNSIYWLGEIKYAQKDFQGAIAKFKDLITKFPDGNKVPDAMLKLGYSQYALSDKENAILTLQKLVAQYPDTDAGKLAKQKLSEWK